MKPAAWMLAGPLAAAALLAPATAAASPYRVVFAAPPEAVAQPVPADSSPPAGSAEVPLTSDPAIEYRTGEQAYALGNYGEAVRHFERSYQLSNLPDLLYNLGMAYAQWYGLSNDLAHLRKAKRLFQNYTKRLSENPQMDQSQRDEVEAQIARIDEQISAEEARLAAAVPPPVVDTAPSKPPPVEPERPAKKPVHQRGLLWGLLGGVVVVGAVVAIAVTLSRRSDFTPELGTIGPDATRVGLRF